MSRRENNIDGVRLYSDNLEGANSNPSKTVQSYKRVQKTTTTTTKTVANQSSNPTKTTVTKKTTTIKKDFGIPRKSLNDIKPNIQEILAVKQGSKEIYEYKGKLKEKDNYLYYVSGVGYVTKDGQPAPDNKPKEIKVLKEKPKPIRAVGQRVTITLQSNRPPRKKEGELVENFEYYESKELGKNNKESIVVHKRLGDPFYQTIGGRRSASYTHAQRSRATIEKTETKTKTIETKTTTQRNQYQNKTYNTNQVKKTNIAPKPRIEKTTTEKRTTSVEQKKYVPTQKKTQTQPQPKKVFDTDKYKRNKEESKYQQKTEEIKQTKISQEQNLLNDPNYCPIHGYHGQAANYDDIDNYKFFESKSASRRIGNVNTNINTNINVNRQNVTEENQAYINTMNQSQMAQTEDGYDLSKLYIATRITPVYSEMLNQRFQTHTHVCRVCGNPFDENQMDMMQQNQTNSMQEMEYDINCPIHGQRYTQ